MSILRKEDFKKRKIASGSRELETGKGLVADLIKWVDRYLDHLENGVTNGKFSVHTLRSYRFTMNALVEYAERYQRIYATGDYGDEVVTRIRDVDEFFCNGFLSWMENYETNRVYGDEDTRTEYLIDFVNHAIKVHPKSDDVRLAVQEHMTSNAHIQEIEALSYVCGKFVEFHDEHTVKLGKIDHDYIENYMQWAEAQEKRAANSTMRQRRAGLTTFLTYISKQNSEKFSFRPIYEFINTYSKTSREKVADKERRKGFDNETAVEIYEALSQWPMRYKEHLRRVTAESEYVAWRNTTLALIMMFGGLRSHEVVSLRAEYLTDSEDGENYDIYIEAGKGNKSRETWAYRPFLERHIAYMRQNLKGEYFASGVNGKPITTSTLFQGVQDILHASGIDRKGLHMFRHYFASEVARSGDIITLQELLGHASMTTTQIYIDLASDHKAKRVTEVFASGSGAFGRAIGDKDA